MSGSEKPRKNLHRKLVKTRKVGKKQLKAWVDCRCYYMLGDHEGKPVTKVPDDE